MVIGIVLMVIDLGTMVFVFDGNLTIIVVSGNAFGYNFLLILFAHVTEPHVITEFSANLYHARDS